MPDAAKSDRYALTARDVQRLRRMLTWYEQTAEGGRSQRRAPVENRTEIEPLRITQVKQGGNQAEGRIQKWDTDKWSDLDQTDQKIGEQPTAPLFLFHDVQRKWLPIGGIVCMFEATQNWTGTADGSSPFPARILKWTGTQLSTGSPAVEIQVRDIQGFSGKAGARGFAVFLFGTWWHITSTCPT